MKPDDQDQTIFQRSSLTQIKNKKQICKGKYSSVFIPSTSLKNSLDQKNQIVFKSLNLKSERADNSSNTGVQKSKQIFLKYYNRKPMINQMKQHHSVSSKNKNPQLNSQRNRIAQQCNKTDLMHKLLQLHRNCQIISCNSTKSMIYQDLKSLSKEQIIIKNKTRQKFFSLVSNDKITALLSDRPFPKKKQYKNNLSSLKMSINSKKLDRMNKNIFNISKPVNNSIHNGLTKFKQEDYEQLDSQLSANYYHSGREIDACTNPLKNKVGNIERLYRIKILQQVQRQKKKSHSDVSGGTNNSQSNQLNRLGHIGKPKWLPQSQIKLLDLLNESSKKLLSSNQLTKYQNYRKTQVGNHKILFTDRTQRMLRQSHIRVKMCIKQKNDFQTKIIKITKKTQTQPEQAQIHSNNIQIGQKDVQCTFLQIPQLNAFSQALRHKTSQINKGSKKQREPHYIRQKSRSIQKTLSGWDVLKNTIGQQSWNYQY